ncbi:UNVERIFIED_CONTAM: Hsp20/alpha crystallin family protein [Microbacterium sp. SLM126]
MSNAIQLTQANPQQPAPSQETAARRATVTPPVDIYEDALGVTVWADLPGVALENLEVKVHDGTQSIEGEASVPVPPNLRVQYLELQQPRFSRAFAVSPDFDTSRISANLHDGVLKVFVPRREEARPRRIEVSAG